MTTVAGQNRKWILLLGATLLIVTSLWWSFHQWREQRMSTNWMGPFLSSAQQLTWGGDFLINLPDVQRFNDLDNVVEEDKYYFSKTPRPQKYIYDPIGYSYLIKASTMIFPWVGHQLAIILLQCLIHVVLCLAVLRDEKLGNRFRLLFFLFYALNPIVLRFVTFNHYYFWQAVPSFMLMFLWLRMKKPLPWTLLLLTLPFVLLLRPTTILVIGTCLLGLFYFKESRKWGLLYLSGFVVLCGWLYVPNQKNPWHTMYTGVGAYTNSYGIELSDNSAYALYQKETGHPLVTSTGGNYFITIVQQRYRQITRTSYLAILSNSPLLLIKNAVVNYFQAFSIGYINKAPDWLNYLVALSGFLFYLILVYFRKFFLIGLMTLTVIGFVPYYPPIQAYMYGNYLLLVWALIEVVQEVRLGTALRFRKRLPV